MVFRTPIRKTTGSGRSITFSETPKSWWSKGQDGSDLLPLIADDVSILVLKMGQGATTSRLTRAAWLKLESVIVDCRYPLDHPPSVPGKLILDASVTDQLWVSLVDEHLVMNGSDSGHSLIFRGVYSSDVTLRGDVSLRSVAIDRVRYRK